MFISLYFGKLKVYLSIFPLAKLYVKTHNYLSTLIYLQLLWLSNLHIASSVLLLSPPIPNKQKKTLKMWFFKNYCGWLLFDQVLTSESIKSCKKQTIEFWLPKATEWKWKKIKSIIYRFNWWLFLMWKSVASNFYLISK